MEGCNCELCVAARLPEPEKGVIKLSGVLDARINSKQEVELYLAGDLEIALSRTEQLNLLKLLESVKGNSK